MSLIKKSQDISPPVLEENRRTPRDRAGLLSQLENDAPDIRRWAALDLVEFPDTAEVLCAQLAQETQTPVREALLTTLIKIGNPIVVNRLIPLLRSEDAALRNLVIEALQQLPEAVAPHMKEMLRDPDADYRIFSINVLDNLKHPQAPAWLQEVVEKDDNINVCAAAVEVLAEVGSAEVIPALSTLPERFDNDPFMEFCVQTAIRRIQGNGNRI
ncbi:MAG: HEAT repeat domain-containing protein [Gammaproteobacteria bacterium]|nr:HEAT repeat domain-containing protein [Gammaproteobacteria bacterium]MCP5195351.1 HEAT repeat domain-containing protein [Gammaproteobacteria bacterium]